MPQISKFRLKQDVYDSIIQAFEEILVQIRSKSTAIDFIKGLLTRTEQIMLTKRLAIMLMIKQDYSYQEIKRILKVSQSTISTTKRMIENQPNNELDTLITRLTKQKETQIKFLTLIHDLKDSFLPPKSQSWSNWRKRQWETRRLIHKKKSLPF